MFTSEGTEKQVDPWTYSLNFFFFWGGVEKENFRTYFTSFADSILTSAQVSAVSFTELTQDIFVLLF